jgi:hypothetical protein
VYAAVEAIARDGALATAAVCDVLAVSRSAFYAWQRGVPSARAERVAELTPLVCSWTDSRGRSWAGISTRR